MDRGTQGIQPRLDHRRSCHALVGSANVVTDGLARAWLQDVVDPSRQTRGMSIAFVERAASEPAAAGLERLDVGFRDDFYSRASGLEHTAAGLRYLR